MADNIKLQLGMFMRLRATQPDSPDDPFAPGGTIGEFNESFLNVARPPEIEQIRLTQIAAAQPSQTLGSPNDVATQLAPPLDQPQEIPFQKAPPLDSPAAIPFQPAPPLNVPQPVLLAPAPESPPTSPAAFQPAGPITPSSPPADPYLGPSNPPTVASPQQPSLVVGPPPPGLVQPSVSVAPPIQPPRAFVDFPERKHSPSEELGRVDAAVAQFLKDVDGIDGKYSFLGGSAPGSQNWNPQLFAAQAKRLGQGLGAVKLALHGAQQLGLYALNWHGRIWNPSTMLPAPTTEMFNLPAIDIMTGGGPNPNDPSPATFGGHNFYSNNETFIDRHLQLAQGTRTEILGQANPPFVAVVEQGGAMGPQNMMQRAGVRLIGANSQDSSLVDDVLRGIPGQPIVEAALDQRNIYTPDRPYDENPVINIARLSALNDDTLLEEDQETGLKRVSVANLFTATPQTLNSATPIEYRPKPNLAQTRSGQVENDPLKGSFYGRGIIPAGFKGETKGFIQHRSNKNPKEIIDDNDAYVPLSFTDIRPFGNDRLRTVYFRPFITNISEEYSPEWNTTNGFGRVDPIKTYGGTTRMINLGFVVHAFAPEDLRLIYEKLMWLTSMVYPEYDKDLAYKSGPVVRMRIGDLISSKTPGGLAGTIEGLSFDYSEELWELRKDNKVPMGYRVAMSFTVLHDVPIGRGVDGRFGGLGMITSEGLYEPPVSQNESGGTGRVGADIDDASDVRTFGGDLLNDYDVDNENR